MSYYSKGESIVLTLHMFGVWGFLVGVPIGAWAMWAWLT